jgi:type II secretory pathway component HofQ
VVYQIKALATDGPSGIERPNVEIYLHRNVDTFPVEETKMRTWTAMSSLVVCVALAALLAGGGQIAVAGPPSKSRANVSNRGAGVTIRGANQRVSTLLQQIMAPLHANYTIDAGLSESYATVQLKDVPLASALEALSRTCTRPFTYRQENGIYHFALTGGTNLDGQRITLDVQNTSLPGAISAFMKQAHGDYILDREIGTSLTALVTMNLTSVPFPAALDSLVQASSMPITYRIESSASGAQVYHFMSRARAEREDNLASGKIRFTDESLEKDSALTEKRVSVTFESVYLSHALKTILDKIPIRYEIDASVDDTAISLRLEDIPLPTALKLVVKATGQPLVYHFDNDVLRFSRLPGRR